MLLLLGWLMTLAAGASVGRTPMVSPQEPRPRPAPKWLDQKTTAVESGTVYHNTHLFAEGDGQRERESAHLWISCPRGEEMHLVVWLKTAAARADEIGIPVRLQVDAEEPIDEEWEPTTEHGILQSPRPIPLLQSLLRTKAGGGARTLRLRYMARGEPTDVVFDVRELPAHLEPVAADCRWDRRVVSSRIK